MYNENYKVAEDVAINDVKAFVEYHTRKNFESEEVQSEYPDVIEYVKLGLITFSEDKFIPTVSLQDPIEKEGGEVYLKEVVFRTRIVASEQRKLSNGIDLKKDGILYFHKCIGYMISQPVAMLDKIGRFDNKVIEQIATLFI